LVHVLPPSEQMVHEGALSDFEAAAGRELQTLAAEAAAGCYPQVETIVLHGNPYIEILAEAAVRKATLIVLCATDRSTFENVTRDRTVHRVLAHASCPVLTLREAHTGAAESGSERMFAASN
jgi:nucleotide-binding universal stress UspA family protein